MDALFDALPCYEWMPQAEKGWWNPAADYHDMFCGACRDMKVNIRPTRPFDVRLRNIGDVSSYGGIAPSLPEIRTYNIKIYRKNFIEILEEHGAEGYRGDVYCKGTLLSDWTSYLPLGSRIVQCGGPRTRYWKCDECGSITGFPDEGREYTLRSMVDDRKVYFSSTGSVFIADDVLQAPDWSKWKDIEWVRYPILDAPVAGDPISTLLYS